METGYHLYRSLSYARETPLKIIFKYFNTIKLFIQLHSKNIPSHKLEISQKLIKTINYRRASIT